MTFIFNTNTIQPADNSGGGGGEVRNQNKTVTPTANGLTVTADSGYTGLGTVTVNGDEDLVASNIKSGVNLFGVVGEVVELKGETQSVTLTSTSSTTFTPSDNKNGITSITIAPNNEAVIVIPTTSSQLITPDAGYSGIASVAVNAVTSAIDANIIPQNIKKDVSILNVIGTLDGASDYALDITKYTKYFPMNRDYDADSVLNADALASYPTSAYGSNYPTKLESNAEMYITTGALTGLQFRYAPQITELSLPKLKFIVGEFLAGSTSYPNSNLTGVLKFPELRVMISNGGGTYLACRCPNITGFSAPKFIRCFPELLNPFSGSSALKYINFSNYIGRFDKNTGYSIGKNYDDTIIPQEATSFECIILGDFDTMDGYLFYSGVTYNNFSTFVFNVTKVPTLISTSFISYLPKFQNNTGSIYVPDNLVDAFKAATNWSTLAAMIKPISQFTNPYE